MTATPDGAFSQGTQRDAKTTRSMRNYCRKLSPAAPLRRPQISIELFTQLCAAIPSFRQAIPNSFVFLLWGQLGHHSALGCKLEEPVRRMHLRTPSVGYPTTARD